MFYFIHILSGALIAKYFPSLWPVIILSIISHFILDIIPHWDGAGKLTKQKIIIEIADILVGIVTISILFTKFNSTLMLVGIFFSLLPDMLKIFYFTPLKNTNLVQGYMKFHSKIQGKASVVTGLITQLITVIILIILLIY